MKLSHCILMSLIDGKPRTWKELYPYLKRRVNPSTATRTYLLDTRRNDGVSDMPLERQIVVGTGRLIRGSIWQLTSKGYITKTQPSNGEVGRDTLVIQITPKGANFVRTSKQTAGAIWKELRHAVEHGWASIYLGFPEPEPEE